ncbi:MAG: DsrE family protein [Candidatus Latescibacteria bacterium]|nr:DsrE family protein [Candidatus Latescibacterota bacterium]
MAGIVISYFNLTGVEAAETNQPDKLCIIWTSGDRDVALKMVFMYTYYSKKNNWWKDVELIVWGPSSLLLSVDKELQDYVTKMKEEGVILEACKACADMYGVSDKLAGMGIDVKYMGKPLTDMVKSGWTTMTF